jgi:hypothetical protein
MNKNSRYCLLILKSAFERVADESVERCWQRIDNTIGSFSQLTIEKNSNDKTKSKDVKAIDSYL